MMQGHVFDDGFDGTRRRVLWRDGRNRGENADQIRENAKETTQTMSEKVTKPLLLEHIKI